MNKGKKVLTCAIIILTVLLLTVGCYYLILNTGYKLNTGIYEDSSHLGEDGSVTPSENVDDDLVISSTGNEQIIKTKSKSTIRVINQYDSNFFEGKKTVIFMFASWCPNCAEELDDLDEILEYYKSSEYNIVFVAHEYSSTVTGLIEFLETDVTYDTEILLDLGRVIRKALDPEASTIPKTYFLDENCSVLGTLDHATTLSEVQGLLNTYYAK